MWGVAEWGHPPLHSSCDPLGFLEILSYVPGSRAEGVSTLTFSPSPLTSASREASAGAGAQSPGRHPRWEHWGPPSVPGPRGHTLWGSLLRALIFSPAPGSIPEALSCPFVVFDFPRTPPARTSLGRLCRFTA